jgi:hypothetical protein
VRTKLTVRMATQQALIVVCPNIADAISEIQQGRSPAVDTVLAGVQDSLKREIKGNVKLEQLVLAGSREQGFVGCMGIRDDVFYGACLLEGIPMKYGFDNICLFARAYDKENMIVVAVSREVADEWRAILTGKDMLDQGYDVSLHYNS